MSETNETPEPVSEGSSNQKEERLWAMFLHFSQLLNFIPFGGIIAPIIIWQIKKDEMPSIVPHAHTVINWQINMFIYLLVCFILIFILIGIFLFWAVVIAGFIFAIIGGIKANEGEVWEYPATLIKVFK